MESRPSDLPFGAETFRLFDDKPTSGVDFLGKTQPFSPPCLEVFSSEAEVTHNVKYILEPVNAGGLTFAKGRVSTQEVFSLPNSDLVPGTYEGGLKLWEGSLDLINALSSDLRGGKLSFHGKRVLELGCGHGLPGIFSCLKGAAAVHFQDFNVEVLQCLTIPNMNANIQKKVKTFTSEVTEETIEVETRFFAGDWGEVHQVLPFAQSNVNNFDFDGKSREVLGYDIILMAETVYSLSSLPSLYKLIKKCLSNPHGVLYMAAKKYYFGVGGGSRQFLSMVERDVAANSVLLIGALMASLVAEVTDGSSNVREVWKLHFK